MSLCHGQNAKECLQRIMILEDQIISELTNFKKSDLEQDDEKEKKKILRFYEECDNATSTTMTKMQQIDTKLQNLIPEIKWLFFFIISINKEFYEISLMDA